MASHGCIRCSKCGGACPLCGTCACEKEVKKGPSWSWWDQIHEDIVRQCDEEVFGPPPDKNDEQKPETD